MKLPLWSPDESLKFMARHDISVSILSLGAPATSVGTNAATVAAFCREMNDYTASLCKQYPTKFGFFATLPSLEDSSACIAEIRYALKELRADGVNLLTSYGGKYLGHQDFQIIWDELDQLAAIVFVHPGLEGERAIEEPRAVPSPIVDWTHETTRTAAHLITTNTMRTHPRCRVILPHGGGTLPYVVNRIAYLSDEFRLMDKTAAEFLEEAKNFYFDLAFAGYDETVRLLLDFALPGHVLYGTDYPFAKETLVGIQAQNIDKVLQYREDAEMVKRGAALKLLPRLSIH